MGSRTRPPLPRHFPRSLLLLPSGLAVALYSRSAWNGFALDDKIDLLQNRFVTGPLDILGIFKSDYFGGWGGLESGHYRPLLALTYKLISLPAGLSPLPYHIFNVALFAGIIALTVSIVRRVSGDPLTAFAAGLLFAAHPINSESVAAIVGLKELASAGSGLLAVLIYLGWREADRFSVPPARWLPAGGVLLALLAGLLYKETPSACLPIGIAAEFAHHRAPAPRGIRAALLRLLPCWPFAAAIAASLGLRVIVTGGVFRPSAITSVDNPLVLLPTSWRPVAALSLLARYIKLYFWPACLASDYSEGSFPLPFSILDPVVLASLCLALGLALAFFWSFARGERTIAFGLASFAAAYCLTSNLFIVIGTMMAERLFFLPCWGLTVALAGCTALAVRRMAGFLPVRGRRAAAAIPLTILLGLGARTWARIGDWKDDGRLIRAEARCFPRNVKLLVSLAEEQADTGHPDRARELYEEALRVRPRSSFVQARFGEFLFTQGEYEKAEPMLRASAGSPEPIPTDLVVLSQLYKKTGRLEDALDAASRAIETGASHADAAEAHAILGEILLGQRQPLRAAAEYRLAQLEDPADPRHVYNLGLALEAAGDWKGALDAYRQAETLSPREPRVIEARALAEIVLGRINDALQSAARLRSVAPSDMPRQENLASALLRSGRVSEAAEEAQRILRLAPGSVTGHLILGEAFEKSGNRPGARRQYEAILSLAGVPEETAEQVRRRLGDLDR